MGTIKNKEGIITEADVHFTADEAQNLIMLIDSAVRADGLKNAGAGDYFAKRISDSFKVEKEEVED